MKLVICEKPSVAKSIASALGVTSRADGCFEGCGSPVATFAAKPQKHRPTRSGDQVPLAG